MPQLLSILLLLGLVSTLAAQTAPSPQPLTPNTQADTSKSSPVIIDYAELYERIVEGPTTIQRLQGEVELRQDSMFIYCDEAVITNNDFVMARGNVVIRQNDTISVFADSLEYFADQQIAYLYDNVVLVNGKQQLFTDSLRYDLAAKRAAYTSRAKLTDGEAQLSSLRGTYDVNAHYANFVDSVFVVRPDFNLLSDTLGFDTESRIVYFEGPTVMATPQSRVYCEDGFYRLSDTTGRFSQQAQVSRGTQRAAADTIWYYGAEDRFVLSGNARFRDGQRSASGDRIIYSERTNRTVLTGNAKFADGEQRVAGERIDYDGTTQVFNSSGKIKISEPPFLLDADSLWFDEQTGIARVQGNVLWQDTLTGRSIEAERVDYRRADDYVKAFGGRPLFAMLVEGDSMFMRADTLLTFREPTAIASVEADTIVQDSLLASIDTAAAVDTSVNYALIPLDTVAVDSSHAKPLPQLPDSLRRLFAYHDVRIYKSDLQAVCDSMTFNELDSAFTLYQAPILWSDTSQFNADTVSIVLRNNSVDKIFLRTKAMIINSPDELFYNQVKGRQVQVDFFEGEVHRMAVRGNAESVYYIQDEAKAYIGVNHVKSARMRLDFGEGELSDIYFYDQPEGDLQPLQRVGQEPKLLEDFRWERTLRPVSKQDLL